MNSFRIELAGEAKQLERYTLTMLCEAQNAAGERIAFHSCENSLFLETEPCARIALYIYLVPRVLPAENSVVGHPTWPLEVRILRDNKTIHTETHPVNQWGGASVEVAV